MVHRIATSKSHRSFFAVTFSSFLPLEPCAPPTGCRAKTILHGTWWKPGRTVHPSKMPPWSGSRQWRPSSIPEMKMVVGRWRGRPPLSDWPSAGANTYFKHLRFIRFTYRSLSWRKCTAQQTQFFLRLNELQRVTRRCLGEDACGRDCTRTPEVEGVQPTRIFPLKRDVADINAFELSRLPGNTNMRYESKDSANYVVIRLSWWILEDGCLFAPNAKWMRL